MAKSLGDLLTEYMHLAGISADRLASALHELGASTNRTTILRWQKGETKPRRPDDVLNLCKALELTERETDLLLLAAGFRPKYGTLREEEKAPEGAAGVSSLHQLPPPLQDFTGREAELQNLREAMNAEQGVTISGLRGMGGVGKTALALKLAEELAARYSNAQFFLDLRGTSQTPLSAAEAMAHVIRGYHPTAKLPESLGELQAMYCSVLHDQRALLVWDNARDQAQVEPLIPPKTCAMLVTSRWHFALPGLYARDLDTLLLEDAKTLLLRIAPRIGDQADAIAHLCGCLPVALRLAGSAVAERKALRVADYVHRLQEARTRLELVEASLTLSYDLLNPQQQRLWLMLSVFPVTFDGAGAASVWELELEAVQDMLDELVRYSLVLFLPSPVPAGDGGGGRYRLHDLLRLFAASHLPDPDRAAIQQRHAAHYQSVLRVANDLYKQGGESG